jgi:hypothetical protein
MRSLRIYEIALILTTVSGTEKIKSFKYALLFALVVVEIIVILQVFGIIVLDLYELIASRLGEVFV